MKRNDRSKKTAGNSWTREEVNLDNVKIRHHNFKAHSSLEFPGHSRPLVVNKFVGNIYVYISEPLAARKLLK